MNTELHQLYEKHYKSTGPLRCSIIDFYIKVNETSIINVHLDYLYKKDIEGNPGDGTDICVDIRPNGMFYLYDNVRNDILLNNINKDVIFEKLEQIERYWNWLQCVYIPKFGTLDDFFYRVFLWIREDLYSFCLYTGCHLDIEYNYQRDENWEPIEYPEHTLDYKYTKTERYV